MTTICVAAPPAVPSRVCIIWKIANPSRSAAGEGPLGTPRRRCCSRRAGCTRHVGPPVQGGAEAAPVSAAEEQRQRKGKTDQLCNVGGPGRARNSPAEVE